MARALRRVSVERGIDPRSCVLVAFGGGGPLHACGLAERLGMTKILVPPFAGVLSALGLALAPERRLSLTSVMRDASSLEHSALSSLAIALAERAGGDGESAWTARARYRGQGHELEVPFTDRDDGLTLTQRFVELHQRRYGFTLPASVDVVSARCTRSGTAPEAALARRGATVWGATDTAPQDDGGAFEATVHGRRVIALPDATLLVAEGWTARTLPIGGWLLERAP
jgi:N-methylhydantoinase A